VKHSEGTRVCGTEKAEFSNRKHCHNETAHREFLQEHYKNQVYSSQWFSKKYGYRVMVYLAEADKVIYLIL